MLAAVGEAGEFAREAGGQAGIHEHPLGKSGQAPYFLLLESVVHNSGSCSERGLAQLCDSRPSPALKRRKGKFLLPKGIRHAGFFATGHSPELHRKNRGPQERGSALRSPFFYAEERQYLGAQEIKPAAERVGILSGRRCINRDQIFNTFSLLDCFDPFCHFKHAAFQGTRCGRVAFNHEVGGST